MKGEADCQRGTFSHRSLSSRNRTSDAHQFGCSSVVTIDSRAYYFMRQNELKRRQAIVLLRVAF
jgi:hypothetical protein